MTRDTFDMFQDKDRGRFGDNELASSRDRQRVNGASDLVDLTLCLHVQTPKAIRVSSDGDDARAQWLPKSQCEFGLIGKRRRSKQGIAVEIVIVTCPEHLAKEKGLI